jgi:predicted LPLAT superfamily acyltransferase
MKKLSPHQVDEIIMSKISNQHWSKVTKRGSSLGISTLYAIYNIFGKPSFYLILIPVLLFFYLTGKEQRLAVIAFQKKVTQQRNLKGVPTPKLNPFLQYF